MHSVTTAIGSVAHHTQATQADRVIHIIGTLVGVVGSAILVGIAALTADRQVFYASVVYSFCLLTMLAWGLHRVGVTAGQRRIPAPRYRDSPAPPDPGRDPEIIR